MFAASRYGRGEADYLNCPFNKAEYEAFHAALVGAERAPLHDFDGDLTVYEGCMPIEVMAARGADTIRSARCAPSACATRAPATAPGPTCSCGPKTPPARLYNLVGFQTNLKWGEQKRVFRMIPGLENADFVRYGVMHRNTFLNSPQLLTPQQCLREHPNVFFAGQITGFEGYMESAASGLLRRGRFGAAAGPHAAAGAAAGDVRRAACPTSPPPTKISSRWAPTWAFCPARRTSTPSAISAGATPHCPRRRSRR